MQTALLILALLAGSLGSLAGVALGALIVFRVSRGQSPVPSFASKAKVGVNRGEENDPAVKPVRVPRIGV